MSYFLLPTINNDEGKTIELEDKYVDKILYVKILINEFNLDRDSKIEIKLDYFTLELVVTCLTENCIDPEKCRLVNHTENGFEYGDDNNDIDYLFDYLFISKYILAESKENFIRKYMYDENYKEHPMNTDKYYDLVEFDEEKWNNLTLYNRNTANNLFNGNGLSEKKCNWDKVMTKFIREIGFLFTTNIITNHVMIAGGYIFSKLFGCKTNDIDMFIHSCDESTGLKIIKIIATKLEETLELTNYDYMIIRTNNALTINIKDNYDYQIILRLYSSPSEIIHGFDVDCCCMGYIPGQNKIIMTNRALYSIENGHNNVSFDRLSPSYEYRLAKYGTRGVSINIPDFDINQVDIDKLSENYENFKSLKQGKNEYIEKLTGLDILLTLDYKMNNSKSKHFTTIGIRNISNNQSDYAKHTPYDYKTDIEDYFMSYLFVTRNEYPEASKRYLKYVLVFIKEYILSYEYYEEVEKLSLEIPTDEYLRIKTLLNNMPAMKVNSMTNTKSFFCIYAHRFYGSKNTIIDQMETLLNIDDFSYELLTAIRKVDFPQKLKFKIINPGEQMTNTFHQIVLKDNKEWYTGNFYNIKE